jgi:hypothetical protein
MHAILRKSIGLLVLTSCNGIFLLFIELVPNFPSKDRDSNRPYMQLDWVPNPCQTDLELIA